MHKVYILAQIVCGEKMANMRYAAAADNLYHLNGLKEYYERKVQSSGL